MSARSYLGKYVGTSPADDRHIRDMRMAVWHQQGVAMIDPSEIPDDFERRVVMNVVERQYGKRKEAQAT